LQEAANPRYSYVGAGLVPALSVPHYNRPVPFHTPRKRIRLAREAYQEAGNIFSVTISVRQRDRVFEDAAIAQACVGHLRNLRNRTGNPVYAYCLMPDHVHLLIGVVAGAPLGSFITAWKSLCYRERRRLGLPDPFWQRGYFDHALRKEEDLRMAALYILNNPVRAGIVSDFHSYPFCGSLEFSL